MDDNITPKSRLGKLVATKANNADGLATARRYVPLEQDLTSIVSSYHFVVANCILREQRIWVAPRSEKDPLWNVTGSSAKGDPDGVLSTETKTARAHLELKRKTTAYTDVITSACDRQTRLELRWVPSRQSLGVRGLPAGAAARVCQLAVEHHRMGSGLGIYGWPQGEHLTSTLTGPLSAVLRRPVPVSGRELNISTDAEPRNRNVTTLTLLTVPGFAPPLPQGCFPIPVKAVKKFLRPRTTQQQAGT